MIRHSQINPYYSQTFCGENLSYFKQGAVVLPENADKFLGKYRLKTTKEILDTNLRPLATDEHIEKNLRRFEQEFAKQAKEYITDPSKEYKPYNCNFSQTSDAIEYIKKDSLHNAELSEFLLESYQKKGGLKNFICNKIIDCTTQKKMQFLYKLKAKYLDSNLSINTQKIIQRIYDDFGVIVFTDNNANNALAIYNALQCAYKTAKSVGDKVPELKLIDIVSIYKKSQGAFYNNDYKIVSINPKDLNIIDTHLKHEISGHALHDYNDRSIFNEFARKYLENPISKYFREQKVKFNFSNFAALFEAYEKGDKEAYSLKDPLEFVACLKESSNFIDFAKASRKVFEIHQKRALAISPNNFSALNSLIETSKDVFKEIQNALEVCHAPRGFFADRIMLPDDFKGTWKEFGENLLKQARRV